MQKLIAILWIGLLLCTNCWATTVTVNLNAGADSPNYVSALQDICPRPINCAYGANFMHLADADQCGCCACHGGAAGCTGGAKGAIICNDGTYAAACGCQYSVNVE